MRGPGFSQILGGSPAALGALRASGPDGILVEDRVERRDKEIGVGLGDTERRSDLDNGVEGSVRAGEDAEVPEPVDDVGRFRAGRLERAPVADELEAEEEPRAADVSDNGMAVRQMPEPGQEVAADPEGPALEPLVAHDVEHGQTGRAGNGVAS